MHIPYMYIYYYNNIYTTSTHTHTRGISVMFVFCRGRGDGNSPHPHSSTYNVQSTKRKYNTPPHTHKQHKPTLPHITHVGCGSSTRTRYK